MGIGSIGDQSIGNVIDFSVYAEDKGFHSVWLAEDYYFRDAFTSMAAVAARTHKITLASGVINPYTRHPALIAMSLATLNELSGGRIIMGIGSSGRLLVEDQMGIPMRSPLTAMRESVQVIRQILSGKKVTFNGSQFKITDVALNTIPPAPNLPIYLAAVGPRMLQLAAEIADGVVMTAGCSIPYVEYAQKYLKEGAKLSGKELSRFETAAYVFCSMNEDSEKARNAARGLIAYVLSPIEYGDLMCKVSGFDPKVLVPIRDSLRAGLLNAATRSVTDEMVDAFSVSGTPQECRIKLRRYRDAGVTLPVIIPVLQNFKEVIELLGQLQ